MVTRHRLARSGRKRRTTRLERIIENPPREVILNISIPEKISTYKQLSKYLYEKYNIDVDSSEDYEGQLFWNPDLRSQMGFVEDFGNGSARLVVNPKYYSEALPDQWRQLITDGEIEEVS